MPDRPSLYDLWQQAGGGTEGYDPERYQQLAREHGHIMQPGDAGYEQGVPELSCGQPVGPGQRNAVDELHMPAGMPVSKEGEHG
jgi:hypothetical protein